MSSAWERKERAREEKLKEIKEQVEEGNLVIRKMTPEEREANPPRPPSEKRKGRRY
jgi:anti-sigma28 factor (negative regulator of flagellin synthesis)